MNISYNRTVNLKSQDILVACKLITLGKAEWSYASLSDALKLSRGEAHSCIKRLTKSKLYNEVTRAPRRAALEEFLIHGVKYAFPVERGANMRGVPTAWAASPLKEVLVDNGELPPVWPHPSGEMRGEEFTPLYRTVPDVALNDPQLYELLALLDGVRGGGARERQLAEGMLRERLKFQKPHAS